MFYDNMKSRLLSDHGQEIRERLRSVPGVAAMAAMMNPVATATGDVGEYDTFTLLEVLYAPQNIPELPGFWLQWYPETITFETEEIRFDSEDLNEYRLAPFVSPNVQGRVMRSKGFNVKSFRPAYTKPKHVVTPDRAIPRRAGERIGGTLSLQQRFDATVADNLRRERLMIENRWDWMACRATVDASVIVVGEDYPSQTVDFQRDPSLTITLAGAAKWDQTTATPMKDIQQGRVQSFRLSKAPVQQLVFGLDAWNAFVDPSHTDVQRLLDNLRRGSQSDFNIAGVLGRWPLRVPGLHFRVPGCGSAGAMDLQQPLRRLERLARALHGPGQRHRNRQRHEGPPVLRGDPGQAGASGSRDVPETVGRGRPFRVLHDDAERTADGAASSEQQLQAEGGLTAFRM